MHEQTEPSILLVDDNPSLVDNLSEILGDAGYSVRSAATCAEARRAAVESFQVALVDVKLPDGDGIELAIELKRRVPDAAVILLTGFATLESAVAAVRAGAWAYLIKPCQTTELLIAIQQAMQQVALLEENRDLARRVQLAEKLEMVGTMAARLAHELRNPLNAAQLMLSLLQRKICQHTDAQSQSILLEPVAGIQRQVKRLDHLLGDFLDFSLPREFHSIPIDLAELIARVVDLLRPQAEAALVKLAHDVGLLPAVAGEPDRLEQAIINLTLNAIQATPSGGEASIKAYASGQQIELVIEDNGLGIPVELRARIFEPFFTTKKGGSGLGLPIVHSIIEQHHGSLVLEQGISGGARFVMRLPAAPVEV